MRLIWVDDDAEGLLSPFQYRFARNGFGPIIPIHFFEDAIEFFEGDHHFAKSALLFDVVLPSRDVKVSSYLGLDLTRFVIAHEVRKVAFLSVVFEDEVAAELESLREQGVQAGTAYDLQFFDKTRIVDPKKFKELVEFLKG